MSSVVLDVEFRNASELVYLRQRARQLARLLGFDEYDQTRICTAVSEISRNTYDSAKGGRATFSIEERPPWHLVIRISDSGPGIQNVAAILAGTGDSQTAMSLRGAQNLMDTFRVDSGPGTGTTVELGKVLPGAISEVTSDVITRIARELGTISRRTPLEEIQLQNDELLRTLDNLRARDLELARMYREAAETNAKLEKEADARERLLAVVSHDLRNPLSAITVAAKMLLRATFDGEDADRARKSAESVLRSAERMERLVADLLDFARMEAGQLVVEPEPQDAGAIIRDCLDMLGPVAAHRGVSYNVVSTVDRPLQCDKERVLQILSNLVGNAIKFTPNGGRIDLEAHEIADEARFSVADTGPGISVEALPHIFNPFWQANRRRRTGIGLGLSITKGLVEAHGGRVWADSKVGVGTTFYFTLPLAEAPPAQVRKVRVTKKLEDFFDGIGMDVPRLHTGDVITVRLEKSPTLIADGWAVPVDRDDETPAAPAPAAPVPAEHS
jgi:signal transduction histidine kinase